MMYAAFFGCNIQSTAILFMPTTSMLSNGRQLSESLSRITTIEAPGRLLPRHLKLTVKPTVASSSVVAVRNSPPHSFSCLNYNNNNPFRQFLSLSSLHANSPLHRFSVNSYSTFQDQNHRGSLPSTIDWYSPGGSFGYRDGESDVSVVLFGWLGAREKHLMRYQEWYNSRGYRTEAFLVGVEETLLKFDQARSVEERIDAFVEELVGWVMEGNGIGKERSLVFHCFSNTGWLVYGGILEKTLEKEGLLDRLKGCIFDSGGGDLTNIKVWAAGFGTAILKRQISPAYTSMDEKVIQESKNGDAVSNVSGQFCWDRVLETILLAALEKIFFVLLNLPNSQGRLRKIESILMDSQPPCPQLYLYSSADRVIPYQMIESYMEYQRKLGRKVFGCDFKTSPHVDHYRTFPQLYSSELDIFLKECFNPVKK